MLGSDMNKIYDISLTINDMIDKISDLQLQIDTLSSTINAIFTILVDKDLADVDEINELIKSSCCYDDLEDEGRLN